MNKQRKCSMIRCPLQHKQGETFDCQLFEKCCWFTEDKPIDNSYSEGYAAGFMTGLLCAKGVRKDLQVSNNTDPFTLSYRSRMEGFNK